MACTRTEIPLRSIPAGDAQRSVYNRIPAQNETAFLYEKDRRTSNAEQDVERLGRNHRRPVCTTQPGPLLRTRSGFVLCGP